MRGKEEKKKVNNITYTTCEILYIFSSTCLNIFVAGFSVSENIRGMHNDINKSENKKIRSK